MKSVIIAAKSGKKEKKIQACKFYEIVNQAQEEGKKQASSRSGETKKRKKPAFVSTTIRRKKKSAFKPTNCVDNYGKIC